jgi:hypothetical protein
VAGALAAQRVQRIGRSPSSACFAGGAMIDGGNSGYRYRVITFLPRIC